VYIGKGKEDTKRKDQKQRQSEYVNLNGENAATYQNSKTTNEKCNCEHAPVAHPWLVTIPYPSLMPLGTDAVNKYEECKCKK
jgi:hypothetical protein